AIYMEAVTAMTQHGGWPMTVFLLPDGTPFYGGTYFPPTRRHGMPSFKEVLTSVADAYRSRRADVDKSADQLRAILQQKPVLQEQPDHLSAVTLEQAERAFAGLFDKTYGGFGRAPKFPQPMGLEALLRAWQRSQNPQSLQMVKVTLDKMAQGGMYDHLGGGFHRYSVDEYWLVPHFEKMLYDNSQLARTYLLGYLATGNAYYRRICEETLDYVLREMTSSEGGFYSTQDADSEGEEGKFFVWTPQEIQDLLGEEDARLFGLYYDVTERGNFEGKNILHTARSLQEVAERAGVSEERLSQAIDRGKRILFEAREQRIHPGRDEKILTAWNGLMLRAFAEAAAALGRDDYREAAVKNAEFVLQKLRANGDRESTAGEGQTSLRLRRSYKDGQAKFNAYLEDYAFYAAGLLSLYEATFDLRWFQATRSLLDTMIEQFVDEDGGGFYDTSLDHEALLTRPKDLYDNATPSGNSVAAETLLRLAEFTGESRYRDLAQHSISGLAQAMGQHPTAFGHWLNALDFAVGPVKEVALVGEAQGADTRALTEALFSRFIPNKVVALREPGPAGDAAAEAIPLLAERPQIQGQPTAYVCQNFTCRLPVTKPQALVEQL
ncbi:MAG TPA: thioredoxin domain-containing protein, partial [Chloroflexota bacterium]|nr:thioredoxin domain-containing protein [Chloroflexota bacterium]